MTTLAVPGVTGRLDRDELAELYRYWLEDEPTGHEYRTVTFHLAYVTHFLGLGNEPTAGPADPPAGDEMRERAASLAAAEPHVAGAPPFRPRLSGNLAEDVREVCGLTWGQIAGVFGISERAAAGWRTQGVPEHRIETMEALRTIGATLVGGLGPAGVCAWLTAGRPSRLERLRGEELEAVSDEAHAYLDTPAT